MEHAILPAVEQDQAVHMAGLIPSCSMHCHAAQQLPRQRPARQCGGGTHGANEHRQLLDVDPAGWQVPGNTAGSRLMYGAAASASSVVRWEVPALELVAVRDAAARAACFSLCRKRSSMSERCWSETLPMARQAAAPPSALCSSSSVPSAAARMPLSRSDTSYAPRML